MEANFRIAFMSPGALFAGRKMARTRGAIPQHFGGSVKSDAVRSQHNNIIVYQSLVKWNWQASECSI